MTIGDSSEFLHQRLHLVTIEDPIEVLHRASDRSGNDHYHNRICAPRIGHE
jgi:hypothetical protein